MKSKIIVSSFSEFDGFDSRITEGCKDDDGGSLSAIWGSSSKDSLQVGFLVY